MSTHIGRPDRPPVIVLGTGVTALGTLRIFGRDGITPIVADSGDALLRSSRWYRKLPPGIEPLGTRVLADWLAALPIDRAVLLPCSDHRVSQVAALPAALRERFPASVPTPQTLSYFVDKGEFAPLVGAMGVAHPFSKPLADARDLDDVPDAVLADAMLKPRDSQSFIEYFLTKALRVSSRAEAVTQLARVREAGFAVILQEYIPGPPTEHFFIDGFIDRHTTVRAVFVRRRLRMFPLDFGNSTAMVSVEPSAAAQAVAAITSLLQRVGYRGIFSAEFKRDPRDGVFKILEVNTRAWWYVDFAARCGVDVCKMAYQDALNEPVETVEHYDVGRPLVFPYHDYFACKELRREGRLSVRAWIRSWIGAMQPVFQLQDPAPGLLALARTMTGLVRNRVGRALFSRPAPGSTG
jgi:predicted ATP-grasp superfamily ATP-dependent carboligase